MKKMREQSTSGSIRAARRLLAGVLALVLPLLVAGAAFVPAANAASPLVAQWHMDAADGAESSGNAIATDVAPGAQVVPGRFGNGLQPGGGGADLIVPQTSPKLGLLQPSHISLVVWFKANGFPGLLQYLVSDGGEGAPVCGGSSVGLYTGYHSGPGLQFYVRGASAFHIADAGPGNAVYDGNWHMAVGTFDGTNTLLYVDGKQVTAAEPAASPDPINYASATEKSFRIGQYSDLSCGASTFTGALDETKVYDRALTATEIARMAAAPGPAPPDLVPDGDGGGGTQPAPITVGPSPVHTDQAPHVNGVTSRLPFRTGSLMTVVNADVTGADHLDWDVTGDGKTDISCSGSQPTLGVRYAATGGAGASALGAHAAAISFSVPRTVSLTAVSATGVSSAASRIQILTTKLPAAAPSSPAAPSGQLQRPPGLTMCGPIAESPIQGLVKAIGLENSCTDMTVAAGVAEARGCMTHVLDRESLPTKDRAVVAEWENVSADSTVPTDLFVSYKPVRINGMLFTPGVTTPVIVFPNLQRVVSRGTTVTFGAVKVSSGKLNLDLRSSGGGRADLGTVSTSGLRQIGGFPVDGAAQLATFFQGGQHYSELTLHLGMPGILTAFGGPVPTNVTTVRTDNAHDPVIDNINIRYPRVELGPVRFADFDLHYSATGDPTQNCYGPMWKGVGTIFVGSDDAAASFRLAPNPPRNGVLFCNGGFVGAGGTLDFGGHEPMVFPGVFLQNIDLSIKADPPVARGGVTMSMAGLATINGNLVIALASPGSPYTITGADGPGFAGASVKVTGPAIGAAGRVGLNVPVLGQIGMASAYLVYQFPFYVSGAGSMSFGVPGITIDGKVQGSFSLLTKQYDLEGSIHACLIGFICGTAMGWVSDRGVAVCFGDIVHDTWVPGGGYGWGAVIPDVWWPTGCKPSRYWDHAISARARAAQAGGYSFKVAAGEDSKSVELHGAGGVAPTGTLTAPGGEKVTIGADGPPTVHGAHVGLLRDAQGGRTIAGVLRGTPGTYTFTPAAGSPSISKVRDTRADDGVSATVTAKGDQRVLRYDAGLAGGKSVAFFERSKTGIYKRLKVAKGGKGALVFTPAAGAAGQREIVAETTIDGTPVPPSVVARFTAPDTVTPGATRGVTARRAAKRGARAGTLVVTWKDAKNAKRYGITVRQADGTYRLVKATAQRHQVRIRGVLATFSGTVTVHAQGVRGDWGRGATARFGASAQPKSAFLDHRELGKRHR
jgi:hypothetical protein